MRRSIARRTRRQGRQGLGPAAVAGRGGRAGQAALAGLVLAAASVVAPMGGAPAAQAFAPGSRGEVLQYLRSISGTSIVSGQHNKEPASDPGRYTAQVKGVTGQYPGLWGGDLMFTATDAGDRQRVVDQARTEWANGSLVTLAWHACPPTGPSTCAFEGGVKSRISDADYLQVVTGGTRLNQVWRQRMAEVVPYLQQLRDAGVPVLFRPFHEMNESWNWWGGRPGANGSSKIYQQMKDYFDSRGLTNLIWVWNVQDNPDGDWAAYYPGDSYVDVASLDVWYKSQPSPADQSRMLAIAGDKPVAVAETGKVPSRQVLESQTRWAYFMVWSEQLRGQNTDAEIQAAYFHPRVLNQGEVGLPD
ncbi:glycosyl hydrolase [Pseudokineococcus basanitobsidens]|uniref:Glycosyl hydrolase n=1 Tax=Pseudokineococcus basanitobsidens TaxID=1926649 RepID=A0ABU8RLP8_9ACTN